MKAFYNVIVPASLVVLMSHAYAADRVGDQPPVHQQKHELPDTTSSGNYLEPQDPNASGHEGQKGKASNTQPKGERFKKEPEKGGTEVKQK